MPHDADTPGCLIMLSIVVVSLCILLGWAVSCAG